MDNIANILMRLGGDSDEADDTLGAFLAKLKAFGKSKSTAEADVNIGGGASKLAALEAALSKFNRQKAVAEATIDVDSSKLENLFSRQRHIEIPVEIQANDVARAFVALEQLARDRKIEVEPEINLSKGLAELATWTSAVEAADRQDIKVDTDVSKMNLVTGVLGKVSSLLGQGQQAASKFGEGIGGVTVNLGAFGVKLTATTGIILALIIAMGVSLVAAAALVVTALASATAAVGALAVAFAAALGPAVAIAVGLFSRIAKILEATKAMTEAKNNADKKGADGLTAAAKAEEQRHDAIVAVGAAMRSVTGAELSRKQAVQGAKDAIVQASRDEATAAQNLALATQDTKDQMVAAYRAIADSAEAARDALLDVEQAKLGIDQAALSTKEAELALKDFRAESGLAGKSFNDLFKKFTDVDADVNIKPFMDKLQPTGGGTEQSAALELQKLILGVQQAKLNEKKATDSLGDAETSLNDKRREAAKFAREGIAAFEPYTAAVRAQEAATLSLADATRKSNDLEAQGIANNPAVIAASAALIGANERLVEARRNAANAAKGAAGGAEAQAAKQKWDALSSTEQGFGLALTSLKDKLKQTFGPGVTAALAGMSKGLAGAGAGLSPLQGAFTKFGEAIGTLFEGLGNAMSSPEVQQAFIGFIDAATQLTSILGQDAFSSFLTIMLNIATAAMPLLIAGARAFAGWLGNIAGKTKDTKKLSSGMSSIGDALKGVLKFIGAVGRVFLAFFATTSGQSKGFITTLTDMANKLAAFLNSPKGKEAVQQFFKDVIPLAVQTLKLLGNFIVIGLQIVQILAPALTVVLNVFNFLLGIISKILGFFTKWFAVILKVELLISVGLPLAINFLLAKFGVFSAIGGLLKSWIWEPIKWIISKLGGIAGFIGDAFNTVKGILSRVVTWIGGKFHSLLDTLLYPFKKLVEFLGGLAGKMFKAGKAIVQGVINGILAVPGKIAKAVIGGLGKIIDMMPGSEPKDKSSPFTDLKSRGKAIMTNLAEGVKPGADELSRVMHRAIVPVVAGVDANVNVPKTRGAGLAAAGAGPRYNGPYIAEQNLNVDAAPGGGLGDPGTQAAMWAMEMRRRGRGGTR